MADRILLQDDEDLPRQQADLPDDGGTHPWPFHRRVPGPSDAQAHDVQAVQGGGPCDREARKGGQQHGHRGGRPRGTEEHAGEKVPRAGRIRLHQRGEKERHEHTHDEGIRHEPDQAGPEDRKIGGILRHEDLSKAIKKEFKKRPGFRKIYHKKLMANSENPAFLRVFRQNRVKGMVIIFNCLVLQENAYFALV